MKRIGGVVLALALGACAQAPVVGSAQTMSASAINGTVPPGVLARSIRQDPLLDASDGRGNQYVVSRTTRAAGTRTPIHLHDHGGVTCVIEGEMTLYLEGSPPHRARAGECYYMPAGRPMAGVNSGQVTAVMNDTFLVPQGAPVWRVVEPGSQALQDQFTRHH